MILEIGREMKKFRKKNNYTQKELADILGISKQTLSNYETGKTIPNISVLTKFSIISKIPIEDIVFLSQLNKTIKTPLPPEIVDLLASAENLEELRAKKTTLPENISKITEAALSQTDEVISKFR